MSNSHSQIDPRGPRFTAAVTLVVFAVVLLTAPAPAGIVLLAIQAVFFAVGAGRGVQYTPTAYVYRSLVRPRLSAPLHLEDSAPPRFAQAVGLAFTVVALVGYLADLSLLGAIATGLAFAAALLNAAFGFCLGCEVYLLARRVTTTNHNVNHTHIKEEVTA